MRFSFFFSLMIAVAGLASPALADCTNNTELRRIDDRRGVSTRAYEINGVAVGFNDLFVGYYPDEIDEEQYEVLRRKGVGILQRRLNSGEEFRINIVLHDPTDTFAVIKIEDGFSDGDCDNPMRVTSIPVSRALTE